MTQNINQIKTEVDNVSARIQVLYNEVEKMVVGQKDMIEKILMGLITGGHILIEGVPGLAKTTTVKAVADAVSAKFQRIQFTPDLLPADILGTQIYNPKTQEFFIKKGPLFHNIVLADEINRAPAKVQSALLEAMQEKQITLGDETFPLEQPFVVLATQNPIEQEGTYPLPEAQLDRFMLKLNIKYPSKNEELQIMQRFARKQKNSIEPVLTLNDINELNQLVDKIYIDPKISQYIVDIVFATRHPQTLSPELSRYIQFGASPRASIFLSRVSCCYAMLKGRAYVVPQDIKIMAYDILRHRIILTYEAEAEGLTTEDIIHKILDEIEVP